MVVGVLLVSQKHNALKAVTEMPRKMKIVCRPEEVKGITEKFESVSKNLEENVFGVPSFVSSKAGRCSQQQC
jgi:hypothetical protein